MAAAKLLSGRPPIELLRVLRISLVENRGAFLSLGDRLPQSARFVLFVILIGAGLLVAGLWLLRGAESRPFAQSVGVALIVGGGLGNLIDRAARGRVVDFVQLHAGALHTGVFNLADVAILAGMLIWVSARRRMEPKEEKL